MMRKRRTLTANGLKKLGEIIRESRILKGWTQEEAAEIISSATGAKFSDRTLGSIEAGSPKEPKYSTLEAIAAAGFVIDDSGRVLDIYDFIDIASECYSMRQKLQFADMLAYAMKENNLSQSVLEKDLACLEPGNFVSIERLRDIQAKNGEPPTDAERRFIVARVDPMNSIFDGLQWFGADAEIPFNGEKSRNNKHHANQH